MRKSQYSMKLYEMFSRIMCLVSVLLLMIRIMYGWIKMYNQKLKQEIRYIGTIYIMADFEVTSSKSLHCQNLERKN